MTYLFERLYDRDKLVAEISMLKTKVNQWNVVSKITDGSAPRPYNIVDLMSTMGNKMDELLKVKIEIRDAYDEKQEVLIQREQLKDYLLFLESLNMKEDYYGQCDKGVDELKRDILIQGALDNIQEIDIEIEKFEHDKEL